MVTYVRRDPYARASLRREICNTEQCAWCGQLRTRLYTYQVESDTGRQPILGQPAKKPFCNLDCFDSYHA